MHTLQLKDYLEGYRFLAKCRACGYGWKVDPNDLLGVEENASDMTLDELSCRIRCLNPDCRRDDVRLTPLRRRRPHHFVGGLA